MRKKKNGYIVLLGIIITIGYILYSFISAPGTEQETVPISISEGTRVSEIANLLKEQKLIRSPFMFKVYIQLTGARNKLQAGDYELNRSMRIPQIVSTFKHGTFDRRLTFPEGWRVEEYADYIGTHDLTFSGADFLQAAKDTEGRLFPDTYLVPKYISAEELVQLMLSEFNQKITPEMRQTAATLDLTLDQVVIIASVVERETATKEDKPIVAGILIKRLKNDWPLQADATIQYVLGFTTEINPTTGETKGSWWKQQLTDKDLLINSPYNSRQNKGLPPTPICNPGLDSINAVLHAKQSEFWYYISDSNGTMHYAKNLEEQEQNIETYLKKNTSE